MASEHLSARTRRLKPSLNSKYNAAITAASWSPSTAAGSKARYEGTVRACASVNRRAIVRVGTTKARATSSMLKPHPEWSASATCSFQSRAGSQQARILRTRWLARASIVESTCGGTVRGTFFLEPWQRFGRKVAEWLYGRKEDRELAFLTQSTEERY
jgi:hypothetical protein